MSFEVLVIDGPTVNDCATRADFLLAAEDAFRAMGTKAAEMSPKHHWEFSVGKNAAFSSHLPELGVMGIKLGTIRPRNTERRGLPPGLAQIVLSDADSGAPLALLDGTVITTMRTAAAAALGAKLLARPDSSVVSVFGTGVVALMSLHAVADLFPVNAAHVVGSSIERSSAFVQAHAAQFAFPLCASPPEAAARQADLIVTATTASTPVIEDAWLRPGTHISAMGSDWRGKQEVDTTTLLRSALVTDSRRQGPESGEGNVPHSAGCLQESDLAPELGQVLIGAAPGRSDERQITVFDSSGIAPQDCAAAKHVYDRARSLGAGITVTL